MMGLGIVSVNRVVKIPLLVLLVATASTVDIVQRAGENSTVRSAQSTRRLQNASRRRQIDLHSANFAFTPAGRG